MTVDGSVGCRATRPQSPRRANCRILDEIKPEAIYFTELDGKRGAVAIVDVSDPSEVPGLAEPFFLSFNADCRLRIAMNADNLQKAGLGEIGERWG